MSKRAEAAALKAYPPEMIYGESTLDGKYDGNATPRYYYIKGYEQAEQDLALTWEDVAILIAIYEQEVEVGNISRYEDEGTPSLQEASEIILKRFKEIRKK